MRMLRQEMVDFLADKLNRTQVLRAAIFDLLTSQSDRHSQVRPHVSCSKYFVRVQLRWSRGVDWCVALLVDRLQSKCQRADPCHKAHCLRCTAAQGQSLPTLLCDASLGFFTCCRTCLLRRMAASSSSTTTAGSAPNGALTPSSSLAHRCADKHSRKSLLVHVSTDLATLVPMVPA